MEVLPFPGVDHTRTTSNHLIEIITVLGIEAVGVCDADARQALAFLSVLELVCAQCTAAKHCDHINAGWRWQRTWCWCRDRRVLAHACCLSACAAAVLACHSCARPDRSSGCASFLVPAGQEAFETKQTQPCS